METSSVTASTFDIIGNEEVRQRLASIADRTGPSPSYLFLGLEGLGKQLIARWFIAYILCTGEQKPCGECPVCRKLRSGNHSDVMFLQRVEGKASIGIDDVRSGIDMVQSHPNEGSYRFWVLSEAERLTDEAQSALLKTLEEPPASLVMILICGSSGKLLPTVVSRCRLFRFQAVAPELLAPWLVKRGFEPLASQVAARISAGAPGVAWRLLQSPQDWELRAQALQVAQELTGAGLWQALEAASVLENLNKRKDDPKADYKSILNTLLSYYRDALVLASMQSSELVVNVDRIDSLQQLVASKSVASLSNGIKAIMEASVHLERNVQTRLWLQQLCIELSRH